MRTPIDTSEDSRTDADAPPTAAGPARRSGLPFGQDILAATLLTLAAIAFIGVAWKSSTPVEGPRPGLPTTELSQNAPADRK